MDYLDLSLSRTKINSLLVLLGHHGLKLNAVHISYITDGVPLFIVHEVKFSTYCIHMTNLQILFVLLNNN